MPTRPARDDTSRLRLRVLVVVVLLSTPSAAPGSWAASLVISGLHVQGNQLLNAAGQPLRLLGVNRAGTEYACIQGRGIFDGPADTASVQAIASWHSNAVRIPLNEDCWLAINGAPPAYSGAAYRQAIASYVTLLNRYGLVAILDLHWNAPGTAPATGLEPMPDQDHAPAFWASVARYFRGNSSVIFDLYNEPSPDSNQDSPAAWTCWRDGGTCPGVPFQAVGMQDLVDAVRATGARNVILLGGVRYASDLSQWLRYRPLDPLHNLAAAVHSYSPGACTTPACWERLLAPVAQQVPLVVGEMGEHDCADGYIDRLMPWLDRHGVSYLAWAWNTWDCGGGPALITAFRGAPTTFGVGLQKHLGQLFWSNLATTVECTPISFTSCR